MSHGLKISVESIKYWSLEEVRKIVLTLDGFSLKVFATCSYLGDVISKYGSIYRDITNRLSKGRQLYKIII